VESIQAGLNKNTEELHKEALPHNQTHCDTNTQRNVSVTFHKPQFTKYPPEEMEENVGKLGINVTSLSSESSHECSKVDTSAHAHTYINTHAYTYPLHTGPYQSVSLDP
jgi:hypothetical protein